MPHSPTTSWEALDHLLSHLPDRAVLAGDISGRIGYCSPLAAEWLQASRGEITGIALDDLPDHPLLTLLQGSGWSERILQGEQLERDIRLDDRTGEMIIHTRLSGYPSREDRPCWMLMACAFGNQCSSSESLHHHLAMERAVADVSRRLNRSSAEQSDEALQEALGRVGEVAGADRSYLFLLAPDRLRMSNTHEWCAQGIRSERSGLQELPIDKFRHLLNTLEEGGIIHIPAVDELPDEQSGFRDLLRSRNIRSLIRVPVSWGNRLRGFVGFDAVNRAAPWEAEDISLLRTLGDIIAGFLQREADAAKLRSSDQALKEAQSLAHIGNWSLDLTSNRLNWSDEVYRIFELDPGSFDASYEGFLGIIHPDDREEVSRAFSESLARRTSYSIEHRLLMADGRVKYVHERCETQYDEEGRALRSIGTVQDISERVLAHKSLLREANAWNQAMDQFDDAICLLDLDGHLERANTAFYQMLGLDPGDSLGQDWVDLVSPHCGEDGCPIARAIREQRETVQVMETDNPHNPLPIPAEYSIQIIQDEEGKPSGILLSIHDLVHTRELEAEIRLAANVFDSSLNAIMITDPDAIIQQVNPAFTAITGFGPDEVLGHKTNILKSDHHDQAFYECMWHKLKTAGNWEGELWNRRQDGDVFPVWQSISSVRDGSGRISHFIAIFSDISEQKYSAERIHRLAHYDVLTDLPNRILFKERCRHALERAQRDGSQVALFFLDLDRFKQINDSLGHTAGDELLRQVAQRIAAQIRAEDTAARLGGDEFVIAIEEVMDERDPERVVSKLMDAFSQPFSVQGHELVISTSIGISLFPADGDDVDTLIKHADAAMYRAKEQGRNNFQFFSADLSLQSMERLVLEADLRRALERNELSLYYQPQYDLRNGQLIGAEALLRWRHGERGMIPPVQFIPIAEESGLILPIGEWVLRQACLQARHWQLRNYAIERISVNLSGLQIQRGRIVETVKRVLDETGLAPDNLELEILETYIMQHVEQDTDTLQALRDLGVHLAIDDFGTGQSSLGYLKRLPVEKLKIDRTFVMDILTDSDDAAITKTIVALGHAMQMTVIAEGVEKAAHVAFLNELGCNQAQGYYFSPPVPAEAFETLLSAGQTD